MPNGVVSMMTNVTGKMIQNSSIPLSNVIGKAVGNMDALLAKKAHIGMRSSPFPPDRHKFRWHCDPDENGNSTPCSHSPASPGAPQQILSSYADQSSLRQKSDDEGWGWNKIDSMMGNDLSNRSNAGSGYLLRGMWNNGKEDEERFFLCEFDEFLLPSPENYSQGEDSWMQVCMPDNVQVQDLDTIKKEADAVAIPNP
jgi:hypothetical protein